MRQPASTKTAANPEPPAVKLPRRLDGFAERLVFIRIFVAKYRHASKMAERLECPPSTYATWEAGTSPREQVDVVARVEKHFGREVAAWLVRGGESFTFTYKGSPVRLASTTERRFLKLPAAQTDTSLSVA
jgi:hypothetical protein